MSVPNAEEDRAFTAFLEPFVSEHKRQLFDRILSERTRWVTVAFEDVFQQHNASACVRSCEGFGVQDVHVVESRHAFRADGEIALGASQWVSVHRHASTPECFADLRERGYRVLATSPRGRSVSLDELTVDQPLAFVFGTEMQGLSERAIDEADATVHIPMHGFTESFNVSVSAALCLWHVTSRLRESDLPWRLSPGEREAVRAEWIRAAIGEKLPAYERRWREESTG